MKSPSILFALLAIAALGVSLPMEWFSHQKIMFADDQPFGNFGQAASTTEKTPVIGMKHSIILMKHSEKHAVSIPITFLIIIGMAGAALALLNRAGVILVPIWGIFIPIAFAGAFIVIDLINIIKHDLKSPGIGVITATAGIGLALAAALTCRPEKGENEE
jgi:hypothetical protein